MRQRFFEVWVAAAVAGVARVGVAMIGAAMIGVVFGGGALLLLPGAALGQEKGGDPDPVLVRRALTVLEKSLSGDAEVAAAKALADLGHPDAIERLEEAVRKNPRDAYAYAALVWIGREPYVERARETVASKETSVSAATTYGASFVRHPDEVVKKRLREIWSDATQDPYERLWAAASLVEMGDEEPTKYLGEILRGKDEYAASVAAGGLFVTGDAAARARLVSVLEDRGSETWDQAAVTLGEHPDRKLLPLLRRAFRRAREPHDRVWLAWALLRTIGYRHE